MSHYLQRLATSALHSGGGIRPIARPWFSVAGDSAASGRSGREEMIEPTVLPAGSPAGRGLVPVTYASPLSPAPARLLPDEPRAPAHASPETEAPGPPSPTRQLIAAIAEPQTGVAQATPAVPASSALPAPQPTGPSDGPRSGRQEDERFPLPEDPPHRMDQRAAPAPAVTGRLLASPPGPPASWTELAPLVKLPDAPGALLSTGRLSPREPTKLAPETGAAPQGVERPAATRPLPDELRAPAHAGAEAEGAEIPPLVKLPDAPGTRPITQRWPAHEPARLPPKDGAAPQWSVWGGKSNQSATVRTSADVASGPEGVEIHIGRIEVTAVQAATPAAAPKPRRVGPSLADYLRQRDGRGP